MQHSMTVPTADTYKRMEPYWHAQKCMFPVSIRSSAAPEIQSSRDIKDLVLNLMLTSPEPSTLLFNRVLLVPIFKT